MKLIVGLGNPGETYKNNRHNVGFMFIDYMVTLLHGYIVKKNKNYLAIQPSNHVSFILTKPLAFMNLSGQAVKILIKNLKSKIKNLVAVHDDLDISLGKFKIQKGVGPKLHNGIESIEKALGRKDFWRIRIGVDNRNPDKWVDGETYVLQNFTQEEKKFVLELFPKIYDRLKNNFIE